MATFEVDTGTVGPAPPAIMLTPDGTGALIYPQSPDIQASMLVELKLISLILAQQLDTIISLLLAQPSIGNPGISNDLAALRADAELQP